MQETNNNPQTLLIWRSPLRPFMKRGPQVIRFYLLMGGIVTIIVLLFGDFMMVFPVWALVFIAYVFTVIEPPEAIHRVTQFGIDTAGATYRWESLSHFYYTKKLRYTQLVLVGHEPYVTHTYIVIPHELQDQITQLLTKRLIYYDQAPNTAVDRLATFFSQFLLQEEEDVEPAKEDASTQRRAQDASQTIQQAAL